MSLTELKPGSDAAVVRNRLKEIEQALQRGVSREAIYDALKQEHDLTFSFTSFCQTLWRARRKVRQARKTHDANRDGRRAAPKSETPGVKRKARGPLKKGEFGPPEGFDPSVFDTRFKR